MRAPTLLHLLVLLLGLSYFLSLNAAADARGRLASRNQEPPAVDIADEENEEPRRMELERNDYPGAGANTRHQPRIPRGG
ncbi:unnamed protein product [Spirodela intermedia]|uniref:Uncharacterized protein n=1 Tax=Spirodela intermedia TaxID=51605 RepID=A0A7I8JGA8_SPIIN|nr:unnamed protein product [Spirodela intermedia]CAA6669198.1 unnamed protein product [Spirodela intermedia]